MVKKTQIITITGGKGGTGKTLCAVNIATMFKNIGKKVLLVDGDVENPNTHLLLGGVLNNKTEINYFKPDIIEDKCTRCGICAENCVTHALLHVKNSIPIPMLSLCSGCKLCYKICPSGAICAETKIIGWKCQLKINSLSLLLGELKPSEARSAAIVENLLKDVNDILTHDPEGFDIILLDTAPGSHCDVELLIKISDFVIPVTEPTKFGKLDLYRIIELIKLLNKQFKVIVNRSSLLGFREHFINDLQKHNIELLGDIPLDNDVISSYCQGIPLMEETGDFDKNGGAFKAFRNIFRNLNKWINNNHDNGE